MSKYRFQLPLKNGKPFITDAGLETELIFKENYDFIPSCSIISKRDDNTDIGSLIDLLRRQNSLATIF